MPTTTSSTTLLESVNIVLANLGESPVNSLTGGALPQQVSLALNTIEEVSTDIQSKGWWFNQQSGGNYDTTANVVIYPSNIGMEWGADIPEGESQYIPEEARRYITIRASRIAQTRLIGSEELQKFSYNEELVSLAILQQAHVRNSNGVLDFNAFPAELRSLGMDEVMFLQGNVEEKIGTLRLGGELANIAKTKAETDLIADQEALVTQQALTEVQETTKRTREAELIDAQEALLQKQILTEAEQVAKVQEEVDLLQTQDTLVTNQAATELKKALDLIAETTLKGKQGSLVDAQATDVGADTTLKGKQGSLVDAQVTDVGADTTLKGLQGSLVGAQTTDMAADTALKTSQKIQLDAQTAIEVTAEKAFYDGVVAGTQNTYRDFAAEMRIMGIQETSFQSSPAYKKVELLKDAEKLRLVTATESGVDVTELAEVNRIMRLIGEPPVLALNDHSLASECVRLLRDTDMELQGRGWWFNTSKDEDDQDVIAQKVLSECPRKYLEYLEVRVAILLTELYPQSGIDIQRLPKMEVELRAYFKDREFDDANYSIFDSYDVAARVGRNRNYSVI